MKVSLIDNTQLTVDCDDDVQGGEFIIRNILGKRLVNDVISFKHKDYSFSELPKGPYFVQVIKESQLFRKKVVRQ